MKKSLFVFVFAIFVNNVFAQEPAFQKVDYEAIKSAINDGTSNFYYPVLMSRLTTFDTTLTVDDYRHLYFGYIFDKNWEPYWNSPYQDELNKYLSSEVINPQDYDEIIRLNTLNLAEFPFDLRSLNYLGYIYHLKGDDEMALKISYRFHRIIEAILSSGDGISCETGLHVISVSHEYALLNLFEFQMESQALEGDCDKLYLAPDERNIESIYFNIRHLLDKNLELIMGK